LELLDTALPELELDFPLAELLNVGLLELELIFAFEELDLAFVELFEVV
jgi:hypothetical protein